jgi:2-succinyl-5-enolpyruvyl-6-hydroxy-3-cyclohexene-1-carboxylate synthase
LVLAASNPVRDVDLAGRGWDFPPYVVANRGVSGIDGTISTAMGVALGRGPTSTTRVLVGDVALLHDLGALVLGPDERRPDLTVVVVNDAGGGIFSLLEPGSDAERDDWSAARFERMFGTPHAVRLAEVCAGLGVPHASVASTAGLRERLSAEPRGLSVLEVAVDRADLRPLHEAIRNAVTAALAPLG